MNGSTRISIKDFSELTGLNESTLRYYDKIGLLSPQLRGENRYRYYSPLQTIKVDFIKVLTRVGVPLSIIRSMHKNRTPQSVLDLLIQQEQKLDAQLLELQTAYSIIHTYRNNIKDGMFAHDHDMSVRDLGEMRIVLGQINDFENSFDFYDSFMKFCLMAHTNKIDLHYPIGGYHEDMDAFLAAPSQPTRFFSLDPHGDGKRGAGQYLVAHHKGYYGEFGDIPQSMAAYARTNSLSFRGPVYVIYLLDEISLADHHDYLSQIVVGVAKMR
jgi:DNA-binding transcriptional MerR regulator